ncbi:unnamed protein product [Caretta caretta]
MWESTSHLQPECKRRDKRLQGEFSFQFSLSRGLKGLASLEHHSACRSPSSRGAQAQTAELNTHESTHGSFQMELDSQYRGRDSSGWDNIHSHTPQIISQ